MISLTGMILKMRYCVVEEIGSGGEGHLYLARDMELGNYWAVKELPISKKREAKLLRLLEHPFVPRMVDYIETEEACYLVMEFIRGKSLGQLQRVGHVFTAEEILSYSDTVLQVLEYLHNQKPPIYYGDLKPDNLMLSETGRLYLVDFGSAVLGFGNEPRICMGTEGFAAPEQYQGKVSERSDLFALGKTIRSLAGRNWGRILWKIPGLWLFVHRCVQPQEEKRLQSAAQAKKMLLNIGKRRGRTRKNMAVVLGTAAVLLAGGMFFAVRERKPSFKEALTEVTTLYYDTWQKKNTDENAQVGKSWENLCQRAETELQKIQKNIKKTESRGVFYFCWRRNAELQKSGNRQRYIIDSCFIHLEIYEGYGKYGLFLLRRGQRSSTEASGFIQNKRGRQNGLSKRENMKRSWKLIEA